MEERLFKLMFENMWFEELCKARKILNGLKNFSVSFWLTDCDGDENLWAEWFIKYYGVSENTPLRSKVDETFCSADIYSIVDYTTEKERIMTKHLKMSPYDNEGKEEAFWRVDSLSACELVDFAKKMQKLDKFFTSISNVSVPNEEVIDYGEIAQRRRIIDFICANVIEHHDEDYCGNFVKHLDCETNIFFNYNGSRYEVLYLVAEKLCNENTTKHVIQAYAANSRDESIFIDLDKFSTEDLLTMCKEVCPTYASIHNLFKDGFDLPFGFAKVDTVKNNMRMCCLRGEPYQVGLSGGKGDDELCVSVFVPNRHNPSHSYDTPLTALNEHDLLTIRNSMKEMVKPTTDYTFDVYIKVTCTAKGINEEEARKKVGEHAQVLANITEGKVVGVMNP